MYHQVQNKKKTCSADTENKFFYGSQNDDFALYNINQSVFMTESGCVVTAW